LIVQRLLRMLKDPFASVRAAAARAMEEVEEEGPRVAKALAAMLDGEPDEVRLAAAAALGHLRRHGEVAAAKLREMVAGETAELREEALRALVQIQPPDALEVFAAALHDPEPAVRRLASAGLMKRKELSTELSDLLADGLRDPDTQVCANIAHVCCRLESLLAEVVPLLLSHTMSPDDGLRLNAVRALSSVPVAGGEPILLRLLEDSNLQIAVQAAGVLLQRDPSTAGLEDVLVKAIIAGVLFREQAMRALESANPALPGLPELLRRLSQQIDEAEVQGQLSSLLARAESEQTPSVAG
jgi:HEAT repeat protein